MEDTKDLTKTLKGLTDALDAMEAKTSLNSPTLKVESQSELSKKYLSPKGLLSLNLPRAKSLTYSATPGVVTHRCVYYGMRVKTSELEKGVQKMAEIQNDLAEKDQIHSILAEIGSLDLLRLPGEEQTSVVFFYPLVSFELADEMERNRPKFYIKEGQTGESLEPVADYRLVLPPGQFLVRARISHLSHFMEPQNHYEVSGNLFQIVQDHLKLLPEGTKFLGANKCAITDLSVPYELFFENSLLPDVSEVDLEYVRAVAPVSDTELKQFNMILGIRYFDKKGKLRHRGIQTA